MTMPSQVADVYSPLDNDTINIHDTWRMFNELFREQENVDILNATAGAFFSTVHNVFWQSAINQICRMTDPSKGTITLQLLAKSIPDATLQASTMRLADDAKKSADIFRAWRNKRIAHRQAKIPPGVLLPVSFADVEDAVKKVTDTMNHVREAYLGGPMDYDGFDTGVHELLSSLSIAKDVRDGKEPWTT